MDFGVEAFQRAECAQGARMGLGKCEAQIREAVGLAFLQLLGSVAGLSIHGPTFLVGVFHAGLQGHDGVVEIRHFGGLGRA